MNTYRIITIKTNDGKWRVACSFLRFGRGDVQVDNLEAGGVLAMIDRSGRTTSAHDYHGVKAISHHPDTKCALVGIDLKDYRQVADLAIEASEKLPFMGAIGWDIASTATGPVIIEANAWWGEPQVCIGCGIISDEIARGLEKRHFFKRWDRTRLHPYMNSRAHAVVRRLVKRL